jgi:hypothetical protein
MKRYVLIGALAAAIVACATLDRAGAMTIAAPAGMQSATDELTPIEQVRWHWHWHPHWHWHTVYWGYHPYYYGGCGYWRPCYYRPWGFYRPWGWRRHWW